MPQSLSNVYIHLIFSTKNRDRVISDEIRPQLHAYIGKVFSNLKCPAVRMNSVEDHIHILFRMGRTISLAGVVEEVKKSSSKWFKTKGDGFSTFAWQSGYGGFSVSESNVEKVVHYIDHQEEHHRHKSFQEEYREFLKKNNVVFDERYVWD